MNRWASYFETCCEWRKCATEKTWGPGVGGGWPTLDSIKKTGARGAAGVFRLIRRYKKGTRGFPIRMYGTRKWRNDAILGVLFGAAAALPAAIRRKTGIQ